MSADEYERIPSKVIEEGGMTEADEEVRLPCILCGEHFKPNWEGTPTFVIVNLYCEGCANGICVGEKT